MNNSLFSTNNLMRLTLPVMIALLVFAFTMKASEAPSVQVMAGTMDNWFGADSFRVGKMETDQLHHAHYRDNVHPFFSLIVFSFVHTVSAVLDVSLFKAVQISHAIWASLLAVTLFYLSIKVTKDQLVSLSVTLLACSSASFIFWATALESFVLGALTVGLVLVLHPLESKFSKKNPYFAWASVNLLAMSITITNLSVGVLAMLQRHKIVMVLKAFILTLVMAAALSLLQRLIFPSAGMFFVGLEREAGYVGLTHRSFQEVTSIIANRVATLLSSGFVLPAFVISPPVTPGGLSFLSAKSVLEVPLSWMGGLILASWYTLIFLGLRNIIKAWREDEIGRLATLFLSVQFVLHLLYGSGTFLYLLHNLPPLVVIVSRALTPNRRYLVIAITGIGGAIGLYANVDTFIQARHALLYAGQMM